MALYKVQFSVRAENDLFKLLDDSERFGFQQTLDYVEEIEAICNSLKTLPNRFERDPVKGYDLRSFPHKAHKIYYHVSENEKIVSIVTIMHGHQLPENHL